MVFLRDVKIKMLPMTVMQARVEFMTALVINEGTTITGKSSWCDCRPHQSCGAFVALSLEEFSISSLTLSASKTQTLLMSLADFTLSGFDIFD